jgi:hypothetical protein
MRRAKVGMWLARVPEYHDQEKILNPFAGLAALSWYGRERAELAA